MKMMPRYDDVPAVRIAVFPLASREQEVLVTFFVEISLPCMELNAGGIQATKRTMGVLQEFRAMIYIVNVVEMSCYELGC